MESLVTTIPREQALRQLSITGFYNPAPTTPGRPTSDNVEADIPSGSPTRNTNFVDSGTSGRGGNNDDCILNEPDQDTGGTLGSIENSIEEGGWGSVEPMEQLTLTPSTNKIKQLGDATGDEKATITNECTFKRRKCEVHNVKGTRMVTTRKTWGKVKNGISRIV